MRTILSEPTLRDDATVPRLPWEQAYDVEPDIMRSAKHPPQEWGISRDKVVAYRTGANVQTFDSTQPIFLTGSSEFASTKLSQYDRLSAGLIPRWDLSGSWGEDIQYFYLTHIIPTTYSRKSFPFIKPSQHDKLSAELISYQNLSEGWDGYEGVPAAPNSISDAFRFLEMKPGDIQLPSAQLASDGEVGLYWNTQGIYAEIGFYGDGTFSWYASDQFSEDGHDGCQIDSEWPETLLLILGRIS